MYIGSYHQHSPCLFWLCHWDSSNHDDSPYCYILSFHPHTLLSEKADFMNYNMVRYWQKVSDVAVLYQGCYQKMTLPFSFSFFLGAFSFLFLRGRGSTGFQESCFWNTVYYQSGLSMEVLHRHTHTHTHTEDSKYNCTSPVLQSF